MIDQKKMEVIHNLTWEEKLELANQAIDRMPKMTKEEIIQIMKEEPYFEEGEEECGNN